MKFYLPLALIVGASTVAAQDQQMEQMLKILPKCAVRDIDILPSTMFLPHG